MNSYQFDSLKFATEGLTGYGSTVIMDNANLPSFMKPINQITNAQLFYRRKFKSRRSVQC